MKQGENHIYCARCGRKLGHRDDKHWYLTENAHPVGGGEFVCVGPCKGPDKGKATGKREAKRTGEDVAFETGRAT